MLLDASLLVTHVAHCGDVGALCAAPDMVAGPRVTIIVVGRQPSRAVADVVTCLGSCVKCADAALGGCGG